MLRIHPRRLNAPKIAAEIGDVAEFIMRRRFGLIFGFRSPARSVSQKRTNPLP